MFARDYRSMARQSLSGKWGLSIAACLIATLLGGITTENPFELTYSTDGINLEILSIPVNGLSFSEGFLALITTVLLGIGIVALFQFIVGGAVELGMHLYFLKLGQDMKAEISDLFYYFRYIGKALGLRLVMTVFVMLWSLLFVIPGIIAGFRYALAPYIMAENPEMGIMEAINQSKSMMDGYKASLFCLQLSFIGWAILSALTLGIGTLFLNPYTQMAYTHFYLARKNEYFGNGTAFKQNMD